MVVYTLLIAADCYIDCFKQGTNLAEIFSKSGINPESFGPDYSGVLEEPSPGVYQVGRDGERPILLMVTEVNLDGTVSDVFNEGIH